MMKQIIWLLFLTNGRLNRKGFWVFFGPVFAAGLAKYLITGEPFTIPLAVFVVVVWVMLSVLIKRYHDLDRSGWWSLLIFLPFLNIWVLIECGFFEGSKGANGFGDYRFLEKADGAR